MFPTENADASILLRNREAFQQVGIIGVIPDGSEPQNNPLPILLPSLSPLVQMGSRSLLRSRRSEIASKVFSITPGKALAGRPTVTHRKQS